MPTRGPAPGSSRLVLLTALLALSLAGCNNDGEDGAGERNAKPDASASDTAASETTPAEPEGPEPATGPVIEDGFYSVHLPDELDWRLEPGDTNAFADGPNLEPYEISVSAVRLPPGQANDLSVDTDYKFSAESRTDPPAQAR